MNTTKLDPAVVRVTYEIMRVLDATRFSIGVLTEFNIELAKEAGANKRLYSFSTTLNGSPLTGHVVVKYTDDGWVADPNKQGHFSFRQEQFDFGYDEMNLHYSVKSNTVPASLSGRLMQFPARLSAVKDEFYPTDADLGIC
jgi:hypothetical protein